MRPGKLVCLLACIGAIQGRFRGDEGIGPLRTSLGRQEGAQYSQGLAIAGDGSVAAVGAPRFNLSATGSQLDHDGIVDIYSLSISNGVEWVQRIECPLNLRGNGLNFGGALALSRNGSRLVVGASAQDAVGANEGRVFVFDRNAGGMFVESFVYGEPPGATSVWASSVDISSNGELVAVAVRGSGAVQRIIFFNMTVPLQIPKVFIPSPRIDSFSNKVRVTKSAPYKFIAGAFQGGTNQQGVVVSGLLDVNGDWTEYDRFFGADQQNDGNDVAISRDGNVLFYGGSGISGPIVGQATVRVGNTSSIIEDPNNISDGEFGLEVALNAAGNVGVVGGPRSPAPGVAWIYPSLLSTNASSDRYLLDPRGASSKFGERLELSDSGNTLVAGSFRELQDSGGFWVFFNRAPIRSTGGNLDGNIDGNFVIPSGVSVVTTAPSTISGNLTVSGSLTLSSPAPLLVSGSVEVTGEIVTTGGVVQGPLLQATGPVAISPGATLQVGVVNPGSSPVTVTVASYPSVGGQFTSVISNVESDGKTCTSQSSPNYGAGTLSVTIDFQCDSGLSTGALIGIIVGATLGGIVLAAIIVLLIARGIRQRTHQMNVELKQNHMANLKAKE